VTRTPSLDSRIAAGACPSAYAPRATSVDAILVAFRSSAVIRRCVQALRTDPIVNCIVVVNNSPGDGLKRHLAGISHIKYLDAPGNVGFSSGVNLARPYIKSPYVLLANPDTISDYLVVSRLSQFMDTHPRCAIVGPRLVTPEGELEPSSQRDLSLIRMACQAMGRPERLQLTRSASDHARAHRADVLIGAFVLCRVRGLNEVGWLDSSIFLFGEDQDLCRRLRATGWELWYTPDGTVQHLDGHSWGQLPDRGGPFLRQARRRELRKARGRLESEAYRVLAWTRATWHRLARPREDGACDPDGTP
jgi:GT2 family glycosyltransferase